MIRPREVRRSLLTLLFAVQAIAAWVPLADARLEGGSAAFPLDGERREDGSRAHLHEHCALCMHLAQREILPGGPSVPDAPATSDHPHHPRLAEAASAPSAPRHDARAPPLV
ncbi:MAG TPA: hypothetical protein VF039_09220 [Longimicrobiales bacterium]